MCVSLIDLTYVHVYRRTAPLTSTIDNSSTYSGIR